MAERTVDRASYQSVCFASVSVTQVFPVRFEMVRATYVCNDSIYSSTIFSSSLKSLVAKAIESFLSLRVVPHDRQWFKTLPSPRAFMLTLLPCRTPPPPT